MTVAGPRRILTGFPLRESLDSTKLSKLVAAPVVVVNAEIDEGFTIVLPPTPWSPCCWR